MMVALSGDGGKGKLRNARIEAVSYWPVERLPTEMALHVLAYNMTRVMAIFEVPGLLKAMRV